MGGVFTVANGALQVVGLRIELVSDAKLCFATSLILVLSC